VQLFACLRAPSRLARSVAQSGIVPELLALEEPLVLELALLVVVALLVVAAPPVPASATGPIAQS
jgi:hypothetical protein